MRRRRQVRLLDEELRKRLPRDQLHHQVRDFVRFAVVVDRRDSRMAETGGVASFGPEPHDERSRRTQLVFQDLYREQAGTAASPSLPTRRPFPRQREVVSAHSGRREQHCARDSSIAEYPPPAPVEHSDQWLVTWFSQRVRPWSRSARGKYGLGGKRVDAQERNVLAAGHAIHAHRSSRESRPTHSSYASTTIRRTATTTANV